MPSQVSFQCQEITVYFQQEGEEFLRRSGALPNEDGDEERSDDDDNEEDDKERVPSLVRDTTMKETAMVREHWYSDADRSVSISKRLSSVGTTAKIRSLLRRNGLSRGCRSVLSVGVN